MTGVRVDRKTLRGLGALVLAVCLAVLVMADPAEAGTALKRSVRLTATSTVGVGGSIVLKGAVTRSPRGTRVAIQRVQSGRWVTVKKVRTTTRKGRFGWTVAATTPGVTRYRAVVRAQTRGHTRWRRATSPVRRVVVTAPVAPVPPEPPRTTRVSVASDGSQGNDQSTWRAMSGDGRVVAYLSRATNLVLGDTHGLTDLFATDRTTGVTSRVSVGVGGAPANAASSNPSLSRDGRYVAFISEASNLVVGDTNGVADVFVTDRLGRHEPRAR